MTTLSFIKRIFSTKPVTLAIITIAIVNRIIQLVFFYNIHFDPSYQIIATENLLNGHGLTISKAMTSDLSTTYYEPLIMWPPGYSFLLTPLYALFNHNYIAAGITLDIIFALLLIFSCRAILKLLDIELYLTNLFTLFTAFFIYFFYFMASSDAIAISLFSIALFYSLKIFKHQRIKRVHLVIMVTALSLCALLKYLYMPVALVIPVFLLFAGIINKQRFATRSGIISFSAITLIIFITLLYQKNVCGQATYISATGRGFYPEHLTETYPFIPASFFNPASATSLIGNPALENTLLIVFKIANLVLLIWLCILFTRHVKKYKFRQLALSTIFFYIGFLLATSIVAVLVFLSVRVEKEVILPGILWTYVQEPRYYGLITVLLHLCFFILLHNYRNKQPFLRYFLFVLALLMFADFFRGIAFTTNRLINSGREEYSWQWENRFQQFADSIIEKEKQKHLIKNVVVAGPAYWLNQRVSIYSNAAALHEAEQLNHLSAMKTRESVLVLAIMDSLQSVQFKPFLADSSKHFAGQFDRFYFYTVYVNPNK